MKYNKVLKIYEKAKNIVNSDLEWSEKYDKIFSKKIAGKVNFEWYDPDTSYQEDVEYFMNGFKEYIDKLNKN